MESIQNQKGPRKRRNLSGEKRYQVLEEVKRNPGKKGEILRREGLYGNDIRRYEEIARDAGVKALGQMRPGKKRPLEVSVSGHQTSKVLGKKKLLSLLTLLIQAFVSPFF